MRASVALTSCNRDRFLVEAIDSVLAQRTDFPFELVIGDDASREPTRRILLDYRARHPDTIRLLLHPEKLGLARNFAAVFAACRGEYVALLDDDDLWTSADKLQKQVDFMDAHPEYAMCFHDSRHFHEMGDGADYFAQLPRRAAAFAFEDLRRDGFIPTSSTLLRRSAVAPLPEWFLGLRSHERTLHLLSARHGAVGFLDEVLSATRIHGGGDWNGRAPIDQLLYFAHNMATLEANLPGMRGPVTAAVLSRTFFELAAAYDAQGDFDRAATWSWRSLVKSPRNPLSPSGPRARLLLASVAHALDARVRFRAGR